VCAQPEDYSHLVDLYATGDIQGAVSRLARWPRERVASGVDATAKTTRREPRSSGIPGPSLQLRAAVMLETDLAAARMDDEESVDFHLGLARRLIGLFGLKKDQDSSARDFLRRWHEFASSIHLSLGRLDNASVPQAALGVSPGSE
jgi:hypothetical protein